MNINEQQKAVAKRGLLRSSHQSSVLTALLNFPDPIFLIGRQTIEIEYIGENNPFAFQRVKNEEQRKQGNESTSYTGRRLK